MNQLQFFPVAKEEEAFSWVLLLIILRPNYVRNTIKRQQSWAEDNKQFFCAQQIICNALPLQINHTTKTTKDLIMWFRLEKTCAYLRHVPRHDFSPSQIFLCSWLYCKLPDTDSEINNDQLPTAQPKKNTKTYPFKQTPDPYNNTTSPPKAKMIRVLVWACLLVFLLVCLIDFPLQ